MTPQPMICSGATRSALLTRRLQDYRSTHDGHVLAITFSARGGAELELGQSRRRDRQTGSRAYGRWIEAGLTV